MLPVIQLDNKGLYTLPNVLSQVPPGAMTLAQNVSIDRPGVAETRRGFNFYGVNLGTSYAIKGFIYNSTILWYRNDGKLVKDGGSGASWPAYAGSYFPPTNNFVNSTQASGNFYFTTNNGVYRLDSLTGTPVQAGIPQALDLNAVVAGAGSAVPNNSEVSYQATWSFVDANQNRWEGAPSQVFVLTNTAGSTQNVTVTATIPSTITTSYTFNLYRTPNTGSTSVTPGNNPQLVLTYQPTSTDITNLSLTVTDAIPDSLLGAYIYTADGQANNAPNNQPPLALDVCTYQGMTFYANFTTFQFANITLDSTGSPNGLQVGDTISLKDINSSTTRTYTASASSNFASQQFKVFTAGSIASNIDSTARELVKAINQDTGNSYFYAYYITNPSALPGAITIQARTLQQGQFAITSSRTTCWTPALPTSGNTYASGNSSSPNGLLVSKVGQPEHVPLAYLLPLQTGNISIQIYRVVALQDAVYVFTNGGVFRVTGTSPTTLQVLLFDSSAILLGLQTPQVLNNSIYFFSTQGICSVSSGGNQIISRNVERDLLALSVLSNFSSVSYGVGYESDRKYLLFCPTLSSDTYATQEYVYNWITQAITTWTRNATAAIVNPVTLTMFVADVNGNIFQERKNFSNTDFADEQYSITINSLTSTTFTLASAANVNVNDIIQQTVNSTQYSAQVTAVNYGTNVVTVASTANFTTGSATSTRSISVIVQYAPVTCGFAEYLKKFTSWQFMFDNANFSGLTIAMSSDIYPNQETGTLVPVTQNGWGTQGWGTFNWGVTTIPTQVITYWPTRNNALAHWINIKLTQNQAFTSMALDGISATFDIISTRGH